MWEKIKAFWNGMSLKAKVIAIGSVLVVIVVKYKDLLMSLILSSANKLMTKTEAKDVVLVKEETAAKTEADQLVKEAQDLPASKPPVTDADWYKKS